MTRRQAPQGQQWCLLVHSLPPEPLYLRAKIRHWLGRAGSVALKNSVYVLPLRDDSVTQLETIAAQAVAAGGEAYVCTAEFADAATDATLVERFRRERAGDYAELEEGLREAQRPGKADQRKLLERARRRLTEIARVDFFQANGHAEAEALIASLEATEDGEPGPSPSGPGSHLRGRSWATRRGVQVDRIACAWLIRRFIDPRARFRFFDPSEPAHPGERRFDTPGGDFSHQGDRCTFEVLMDRAGVRHAALEPVAEIVHDIDIKDGKFGRSEARGIEQLLLGMLASSRDDETRLKKGFVLFDDLYSSFSQIRRGSAGEGVKR